MNTSSRLRSRTLMAVTLWLTALPGLAQNCQVVVSRPNIELGNQYVSTVSKTLFTQQELTAQIECEAGGPIGVRIEGTADSKGSAFHFGNGGRMTLTLLSARYNGVETALRLTQPYEKLLAPGESTKLTPGSELLLPMQTASESRRNLTLQLRLDFPFTGKEMPVRDLTELEGQIRLAVES